MIRNISLFLSVDIKRIINMKGKIFGSMTLIAILALAAFIFVKFYFVFGEGVKAGELNYVVYKGYVFKTYEGSQCRSHPVIRI